jgi:uncharacterized membrane protein
MISLITILFLIFATILGSYGSVFLKKGAVKFSLNPTKLLRNKEVLVGIFLFGISMIFYIPVLKYNNLSIIYPLSSFTYVVVAFLSTKYLDEKMNKYKWIGIIFIILGSFLIVG